MGYLNKVILMGNLTANPEVNYIRDGDVPIAKFRLAMNRKYKQGDEVKEEVCFVDIVSFGKTAGFVGEYLTKGISVLVEGRLSYQTWEKEGVKRSKHEVVAENIQFTGKKETGENENAGAETIPF